MTPMFSTIPIDQLQPSPTNPRKTFDDASMSELTRSVQAQGILQPILVRPTGKQAAIGARTTATEQTDGDLFEIVAGERRYRAALAAGLTEVPCMVRALTDIEVLRIQVIENLQRQDLNELEEAEGYQVMMRDHGYTAIQLAAEVHKSPEYIYGRVKLLACMPDVRRALASGRIPASVALLIARIPVDKLQLQCLQEVAVGEHNDYIKGMSARQAAAHIQQKYMLTLKRAPFDTKATVYYLRKKDLQPLPPCHECPKRTGATPELFRDVESPDTCTDPVCFAAKKEGEEARVVQEAEAKGLTVITGAAAREIMPHRWDKDYIGGGYVRPGEKLPGHDQPLKKLLGEHMPEVILVQSPHDKTQLVKVIEPTALAEAFKKAGIKASLPKSGSAGGGSNADWERKREADRVRREQEIEIRTAIWKALRAKMEEEIAGCGGLPWEETVRAIASDWLAEGYAYDDTGEILLRAHDINPDDVDNRDAMRCLIRDLDMPGLFLLLWSTLPANAIAHAPLDKTKDPLLIEADKLKVDVQAIETEIKLAKKKAAAAAKVKDEKPAKAGPKKKALKDASTEELEDAIGMAGEPVAETIA